MKRLKVLFLAANPPDTPRLRLDVEIREITEKIRASEFRDALELVSLWAVRPDDLIQALNEHKPQIVHFSGHGAESGIALDAGDGRAKTVDKQALTSLFRVLAGHIRIVVLNACFTETQAGAITTEIDCAVGTSSSIGDLTAITFAASFYRAIGFGTSVQEAFDQGRAATMLAGLTDHDVLHMKTRLGVDPSRIVMVGRSSFPTRALDLGKDDISIDRFYRKDEA